MRTILRQGIFRSTFINSEAMSSKTKPWPDPHPRLNVKPISPHPTIASMPRLKNAIHEKFAQLLSLKHLSQHAAWLEAIGPQRAAKVLAKNKRATSLTSAASKLAAKSSIRAREEIEAENEAECRWGRKQLLDFYCDVLERGAGTLVREDRLCQSLRGNHSDSIQRQG